MNLDDIVREFLVESYENLDRLDQALVALEEHQRRRERYTARVRRAGADGRGAAVARRQIQIRVTLLLLKIKPLGSPLAPGQSAIETSPATVGRSSPVAFSFSPPVTAELVRATMMRHRWRHIGTPDLLGTQEG